MPYEWIVRMVHEDPSNPPKQAKPVAVRFGKESEAEAKYKEFLKKGLPDNTTWSVLFLDRRTAGQDAAGRSTSVIRHHLITRGPSGEPYANDLSKIINID